MGPVGLERKSVLPAFLSHMDIDAGGLWVGHNLSLSEAGKSIGI